MNELSPLSPAARWLFHVQALARLVLFWMPATTVAVGVGVVAWEVVPSLVLGASFLFAQFLLAVWWPSLAWSRWGYAVTADELLVARGVVFRSVTAIPLGRVQHVDVRAGPFEQWLGLARVHVHTASGLGSDGIVPGLDADDADALRDRLVARAARTSDGV